MSDPFGDDESDLNVDALVLLALEESRALCFDEEAADALQSDDPDLAALPRSLPGAAAEAAWIACTGSTTGVATAAPILGENGEEAAAAVQADAAALKSSTGGLVAREQAGSVVSPKVAMGRASGRTAVADTRFNKHQSEEGGEGLAITSFRDDE